MLHSFPAYRTSGPVATRLFPSFARLQRYNAAQVDLNRNWWDDSFPYGEQLPYAAYVLYVLGAQILGVRRHVSGRKPYESCASCVCTAP